MTVSKTEERLFRDLTKAVATAFAIGALSGCALEPVYELLPVGTISSSNIGAGRSVEVLVTEAPDLTKARRRSALKTNPEIPSYIRQAFAHTLAEHASRSNLEARN